MGLPGAGKTTLARELHELILSLDITSVWLNENQLKAENPNLTIDMVHEMCNNHTVDYIVADFEAPTSAMRRSVKAHYTIWVNTIPEEEYQYVNNGFEPPFVYNFCVNTKDAPRWAREIFKRILFLENH